MSAGRVLRCAIYTRKSSDEGLDQAFNSLDAQREAGEAYVKSQASEGWRVLSACYDDGGFSGGTMERPGLQRLLGDIEAGKVDVVVVYKIDRLTRSLADFARIVEQFDARQVSFVSVTQAFNTTSSMGRLTLNVLLSFAQFEREVTGERIRDKIAASKAKGMWMGGAVPLGYDLPDPGSRTLRVHAEEATTVRHIFARYLELASVHRLAAELAAQGIVSKRRTTAGGKDAGGLPFSRGALFHLLQNRLYLGKIIHKSVVHDGAHDAIVDVALFDAVRQHLAHRRRRRRHGDAGECRVAKAMFTGRIRDAAGEAMSPAFSYGRNGRIYRYYVSASLQQGGSDANDGVVRRIAAPAIETLIISVLARLMPQAEHPDDALLGVRLRSDVIVLTMLLTLMPDLRHHLLPGETITADSGQAGCDIAIPISLPLRGGKRSISAGLSTNEAPDQTLITALRRAHSLLGKDKAGAPVLAASPASPYERRLLKLAFLAPDLQRAILTGTQPAHCNLEFLLRTEIPIAWSRQPAALGWRA
jgi:site-specific DNA recombinase